MRNVILFIAISLDGYIADQNGKVDWLLGQDNEVETEDSYAVFEKEIDTVIMGWNTYHQVITELSPKKWVYDNLQTYVVTHRELPPAPGINFLSVNPCALVSDLKQKEGKGIWICGGANLINALMQNDLIDRYHISIIPTLLGNGISLFPKLSQEIKLRLVTTKNSNGIMEMIYERRDVK